MVATDEHYQGKISLTKYNSPCMIQSNTVLYTFSSVIFECCQKVQTLGDSDWNTSYGSLSKLSLLGTALSVSVVLLLAETWNPPVLPGDHRPSHMSTRGIEPWPL